MWLTFVYILLKGKAYLRIFKGNGLITTIFFFYFQYLFTYNSNKLNGASLDWTC